jgi:CHAT domain-containing protein
MLRLAEGKTEEALGYLELGRASLVSSASPMETNGPLGAVVATPRIPNETVVEYALVGDTLLTWVLNDGGIHLARGVVAHDSVAATVRRTRDVLELGTADAATVADLTRMYDWLIRPVAPLLTGAGASLTIIADGEVAGVPFAALRDSATSAYLVESHAIRFASSLRDASARMPTRTPTRAASRREPVVLIGNPTRGQSTEGQSPLSGADQEIASLEDVYEGAKVVSGEHATRRAFTDAMERAAILHFAGHAVFDDDRPERSYLVVAPDSAEGAGGALQAGELARFDLHRLRLVVLAACETLHARRGRSGAVSGLAAAFLSAGAAGVVGADWRVDDRLTRDLMVAFHRAYRALADGPRALQAAQLEMLRSTDASHRPPAAWAAFRYAGS